ncbi:MAG: hypothetical protein ACSHX3_15985 [Litorimonas sp.]
MELAILTGAVALAYMDAAIEAYGHQNWKHFVRETVISILYFTMSGMKAVPYLTTTAAMTI